MPPVLKIQLDVSDYKKKLDEALQMTEDLKKRFSDLSDSSGPAVTVAADTENAEKKLDGIAKQVQDLPAKKDVKVNVKTTQSGTGLRGIWKEMTSLQGGAKRLVTQMLAGGGAIGIVLAGIQGAVKAVTAVYDLWTQKAKDTAEIGDRNAESLREAGRAQEDLKQKTDAAGGKLQELASQEKLSNAAKAEAINLINELSQGYGNLGVEIDSVTGKISGLDAALIKKAGIDKERQLANLRAQLKQEEANRDLHTRERDDAGFRIPGSRDMRIGGAEKVKEEQSKIDAANSKIMELRKQIREIEKTDPVKRARERLAAEVKDLEKQLADDERRIKRKRQDEVFSDSKSTASQKIESRKKVLDDVLGDGTASLFSTIQLRTDIKFLQDDAKRERDPKRRAEIEDQILGKRKELLREELRHNKLKEDEYNLQKQIEQVEKDQAEALAKMKRTAETEVETARLLLNGEYDKANALKLNAELKERNLEISEKEKQNLLDQKKLLGSMNLRRSFADDARNMLFDVMTRAGAGKDAAAERAILSAEKTKGAKLTDDETELVRKISALQYGLSNIRQAQLGDGSIQTNSLTSRGGYAGGAVMTPIERINSAIQSDVNKMSQVGNDIRSLLRDILKE